MLLDQSWMLWAAILAIGFPIASILLGQAVTYFQRHDMPYEGVTRTTLNVLLPLAALYILVHFVFGVSEELVGARLALSLLLLAAILVALALFNAIVFGAAEPDTWRAKTPRLFRDLILSLLVAVGAAFVLAYVWDQNVAAIFTALGIGSVILGFALQETLGNVMLGISLLMERPFSEGDWIETGGIEGRVSEINWRATRITTRTGDTVIIPHGVSAKQVIVNNSIPTKDDRIVVDLGFAYSHPPNQVKDVLLEAIRKTDGVLTDPPPAVVLFGYGDSAITYRCVFSSADAAVKMKVRDAVMTRIWYAAQRSGIEIPYPIRTVYNFDGDAAKSDGARNALASMQSTALFRGVFDEKALDQYATGAKLEHFSNGEVVIAAGRQAANLYLIAGGEALLTCTDARGRTHEIYELGRGEFFGETTLLSGFDSPYTAKAIGDLQALALPAEAVHRLIENKPSLAMEIGRIMDIRRRAVHEAAHSS